MTRFKAACAAFLLCCFSTGAVGHGAEDGEWRAIPEVAANLPLTLQVQRSPLGNQAVLEYHGDNELTILGDDGRGFLRFTSSGVLANWNHPDWFISQAAGERPIPEWTKNASDDDWRPIATAPSWGWYDRRLTRTEHAKRWHIPARHQSETLRLEGRFEELKAPKERRVPRQLSNITAEGRWYLRIIPDVSPAFRLTYHGQGQLEVLDAASKPFLRLDAKGVEARIDNETWQSMGRQPLSGEGWRRISHQPSYTWVDKRLRGHSGEQVWELLLRESDEHVVTHRLHGDWLSISVEN